MVDNGNNRTSKTLLLDVLQAVGRVEGQNQLILTEQARASDARKEIYRAIEGVTGDVRGIKVKATNLETRVAGIEPDVLKMKAFRQQMGVAVVAVTTVVTGSVNLIWIGLAHIGDLKIWLRDILK